MQNGERLSLEQIGAFLEGSTELEFQASHRRELYEWVGRTLVEQEYGRLGRAGKGLVRRYLAKMTGLSRAQVTRLIGHYKERRQVRARGLPAAPLCQSLRCPRYRAAGGGR